MGNIIEIKNLTKRFDKVLAVDNISFSVKQGEIFGFLGPNGAGKTTTLSMLATLLSPTKGKASVNGFDIEKQRDNVRHSIGMVFQDPTLDEELTAYENMDFHGRLYNVPKNERKKKIIELLQLVELDKKKNDLVKTFSGGMRRRLEIARGLLHEPKVLFLDEPTLGLDPQTRNKIWAHIKVLNKEKNVTIILTTHYMDEADKLCDRIAIIDNGKIVAINTSANLKNKIGGDIITIGTNEREKLLNILKKYKFCKSFKEHNSSLTINVEHAETRVAEIVKLADRNKITIHTLAINKPTLEDVFLYYTGKTIREEEATPEDNFKFRVRRMRR
ncbi:MAG: ATP-binding cassette domain-containing protein [Candidatus Nanoarchaeia archaeon]|nr:ATP-binding cassette domain-containing protein [Candidatus Nanoarchaeia archaeon]MDD5588375.1 ATP-binding cassette domain-containing protein [Candidatus Nanoarchaeia archaeon]